MTEQEEGLRAEIAEKYPLVSDKLLLDAAEASAHLTWTDAMRSKYDKLKQAFSSMRIIRPDGNCFYRAYSTRLLEQARVSPVFASNLKTRLRSIMTLSVATVHAGLSVDEFHEAFIETLDSEADPTKLDDSTDLYIVTFMRCLTSAYLQTHEDEFLPFLAADGNYGSIADFCRREVDPMYKESDQLQITALTEQVGIPVEVFYLDRSDAASANVIRTAGNFSDFYVTMVYKPGHYDILYT
jgi:ubiquitin thioesterase protein OTUB1